MLNQDLAPVVLFVYNRPSHTEKMLESLKKNKLSKSTEIYVYADGPKDDASEIEIKNINKVRELLKKIDWCKKITVYEKRKNNGLASSIISGVTEVINKHGKVIVLEDDLILSPHFLEFMNEGLNLYQASPNVYSVSGFMFPLNFNQKKTVLLPYIFTWGWATWKNKWEAFDSDMKEKEMILTNRFLAHKFNLGDYKYTDMLHFENNSWGIKWYYSVFLRNGLSVFPTHSLVKNIGFDGTGTNSVLDKDLNDDLESEKIKVERFEKMDLTFYDKFINYFENKQKISFLKKLRKR